MLTRVLLSAAVGAGGVAAAAGMTAGVVSHGQADGSDVAAPASAPALRMDATGPLFTLFNMQPGDAADRCVVLTNEGSAARRVGLFGTGGKGALAPYLRLTITRGSRPPAPQGSCAGFSPSRENLGASGEGVEYDGLLSDYPTSAASAILRPGGLGAGDTRTYRIRIELTGNPPQNIHATEGFRFGAMVDDALTPTPPPPEDRDDGSDGRAPSGAPEVCHRVDVPNIAGAGLRRIPGRIDGRPRWIVRRKMLRPSETSGPAASLGLRVWTTGHGQQLVLALGEARTLGVAPPRQWARVAYRFNGGPAMVRSTRPYIVLVDADASMPGENRLSVAVFRRDGSTVRAEFHWRAVLRHAGVGDVCTME